MSNLNFSNKYVQIKNRIIDQTIAYLKANPVIKSLIVGVSGGVDSALVCVLAREVCDRMPGITLKGFSIPITTNKDQEIDRARKVGHLFCHKFMTVDWLARPYFAFVGTGLDISTLSFEEKIRHGNIKARVRMIFLYDAAHRAQGMVLSTDNLTEFLLGFWTLHGDVGDYGMIQNLWKTEVYGLAEYLANEYDRKQREAILACVRALPTDGLGITNSDLDQLGVNNYYEGDHILKDYLTKGYGDENHPIIKRHLASQFKRNNPVNIPREAIV